MCGRSWRRFSRSGPGRTPPPPARAHRPPVRSRDGTTVACALDGAVCIGEWRHKHTPTHRSRLDTGHGLFSRHLVLRLHGRPTHTSTLRPTDLASTPDRPLQPPLGPGPPRPAVSHTQCHPNNSENEGSDSPRGPEQRSSDQDEGDSLPWHAQYRGTRNRRNNQPSQSETNKPTVHFRWETPGAYHPVRSSEQPTSPNRPSNQPVQTQQPSSALPVGTTWCLATTNVRTTNQSESSEQPTSPNPTNRVAHFRWEPPGALLPPTSMRSETGEGVGQCIPRQRVSSAIRRRAPH